MEPKSDDTSLILGCLEGRKESWDLFVERFSKLIYWSIRKTFRNSSFRARSDLIGEVFQEVFIKLLAKEELIRLRRVESVTVFLRVVAHRTTLDKIKFLERSERKYTELATEPDEEDPSRNPLEELASSEKSIVIESIFEALTPKEKQCVEWHYMDGKSHREIGGLLGLPLDNVSSVIRRIRQKLKRALTENGVEGF